MIPHHIARLFTPALKARGNEYFEQRRVTDVIRHASSYSATVRGTSTYHVRLSLRFNVATSIDCSCPWFEDHRACKHLWALLLAIDAREEFPADNVNPGNSVIASAPMLPHIPAQIPATSPDWQQRLKRVQRQESDPMRLPARKAAPLTEPLFYRIDADHLRKTGQLVLEVSLHQTWTRSTAPSRNTRPAAVATSGRPSK